jgi:dCMP deaminase
MTESELRWAKHFFAVISVIRTKSKDINTQVGCIIVGPDNEIRSTGYNSPPRGIEDKLERISRPLKYDFCEHAERNSIYNAARSGIATKGCTIYMQGLPCVDCARAIIQAGINRIIYDKEEWSKWIASYKDNPPEWYKKLPNALAMLSEAKIEVIGI